MTTAPRTRLRIAPIAAPLSRAVLLPAHRFSAGTLLLVGLLGTLNAQHATTSTNLVNAGQLTSGTGNSAIGGNAVVLGQNSTASGSTSFAFGIFSVASGQYSVAMGSESMATGFNSFSLGDSTLASGGTSIAMGQVTTASGYVSTAFGSVTTASGTYATAFGESTTAQAYGSFVLGRWNVVQGDSTTWVATDDLFVVGNGTADNARSNAFTIKKNGNTTINGTLQTTGTVTTPSVTFPDGVLSKSKTNTLYNAAGTAVATVDADGKVNFANGLSVGTGTSPATLTPNSTAYLNQTLANLGFRETPTATPVKTIATTGSVQINAITQDAGFVYVVGTVSGYGTIGSTFVSSTSSGASSPFVAKLTQAGVGQWARAISSSGYVSLTSIAVDASGNVVVAGAFAGTTTGLSSPASNLTSNSGGSDAFVVKYNASGQSQWAQRVGGTNSDIFNSIAVDTTGNVIAAGQFSGTTTGLDGNAANLTSNLNNADAFLVKYSAAGQSQWAQRVGGPSPSDTFSSVAVDATGSVIAVGSFAITTTGLTAPASNLTGTGGSIDALVVKYDAAGQSQWARGISANGSEYFNSVAVDASGNIFAVGQFYGTSAQKQDAVVVKFDTAGQSQWTRFVGGTSNDTFVSVAVDGSGRVIAAGTFSGTTTGLPTTPINQNLVSTGTAQNGMLVTYDSAGVPQSAIGVGTTESFFMKQISARGGSMWLVGTTSSSVPLGNTRAVGSFAASWTGSMLVTAAPAPVANLAWSGSNAENGGVALGASAYASASDSVALGRSSAVAPDSFAAGGAIARGIRASAFGGGYATGESSLAFGANSFAGGYGSFAGPWATAEGNNSFAMGDDAVAFGYDSFAFGDESRAGGNSSIAFGSSSCATGDGSLAIGVGTEASGTNAVAVGGFIEALGFASTVFGRFNVLQGNRTTWVATDDLFVLGNGTGSSTRSNALAVHKNGNTRVAGAVEAKGGFRTPPMGDIGMGDFTAGANPNPPAPATTGLNAGLRYPGE